MINLVSKALAADPLLNFSVCFGNFRMLLNPLMFIPW